MLHRQRIMICQRLGHLVNTAGAATFDRFGYLEMKFGTLRTQQAVIKCITHEHMFELEIG